MAGGEVCKETFYVAAEPTQKKVRLDIPAFSQKECCFKLPVLAELVGTDEFKNDQHSVLKRYDKNLYSTVIITLQKHDNGDYVDQVDLFDDTYGTNYHFGFVNDSENRNAFVGYNIEWQKVLDAFGEGTYRIKFKEYDFGVGETESFYQFEFCLKAYMQHRADQTVRFEWYTKGYRGDYENDSDIWDFTQVAKYVKGDGWFNQMRLPDSFFGFNKSSYEREYIRYTNGQQVWISDEQVESYEFHSGMFPAELHDWIKTNIIQADKILATDYNKINPNIIANKNIKPSGSYEPSWNHNNLRAFVSVDFEQGIQNRKKLRC
jgi:hypothetical protein